MADFSLSDGDTSISLTPPSEQAYTLDSPSAGAKGEKGEKGDTGAGVPTGGTTGQVLAKASDSDLDTEWVNQTGGGGGGAVDSVNGQTGTVILGADDIDDTSTSHKFATSSQLSKADSAVQPGDLSSVATSGSYNDLSNKPSIPSTLDDLAEGTTSKSFTSAEKSKLSGITAGATANDTDANLKNRANHTGTQAIATITNLQNTLDGKQPAGDYATNTALSSGLSGKANSSHTHPATDLTATGRTSSNFLRGDNTWATPTNTTYSEISEAEITTGTASNARTISGRRAQFIVDKARTGVALSANLANVATSGNYADLNNKPTIPAQFNPIAGSNITLSGSYPNITFTSTGGGGGGGGDMFASVYDPNSVTDDAFDMDNMTEGSTNKILSSAERSKLSGIEAGAEVNTINAGDGLSVLDSSAATKLSGIAVNATANDTDANLKNRANHTGTQTASTISDFDTEVSNNTDVSANTSARHTHSNIATLNATTASFTTAKDSKLTGIETGAQVNTVTSVAGKTGAVTLAKGDVGLGNVDNTSDASKPISSATQSALNAKADTASLSAVATSGDYADLSNKPTIPDSLDDLSGTADDVAQGTTNRYLPAGGSNNQVVKMVSGTPTWSTDANTTYSEISEAEITTGTASTARAISARRLKFATDSAIANVDLSRAPNPYVEGVPLYSIGHSYTMYPYPYGTRYTGEYYMRIKDRLHLGSVTTIGRSGTYAADNLGRMISPIYDRGTGLWTPNSKGICLIQNSINELGQDAASETKFRNLWAQSIRGEIAVMSSKSIKGFADATAQSAGWTSGAGGRDKKGVNGTTYFATGNSNSWVDWTVSQGDEVWVVGAASIATYDIANFSVRCNGTVLEVVNLNGIKPDYSDKVDGTPYEYTPWAVKITGLNAAAGTTGSKTVRVQTSGTSSSLNTFISGIIEPSPNPPMIFLAKEPPRINVGEANYNANIGWFNAMTDTIASEFDNVVTVDLANGWDNNTMIGSLDSSNFHPNDIGQSKTADNFVQAINENITDWIDGVAVL